MTLHRFFTAVLLAAMLAGCARTSVPTRPVGAALANPSPGSERPDPEARMGLPGRGSDRVPVALGDQWVYARRYQVISVSPTGDRSTVFDYRSTITDRMVCIADLPGGTYAFRQETELEQGPGTSTPLLSWVGERQDVRGLYELDVNITTPPPCLAGSAAIASPAAGPEAWLARLSAGADPAMRGGLDASSRARRLSAIRELMSRATRLEQTLRPRAGARLGEIQRLAYPLHVGQQWYVRNEPPDLVLVSRVTAREVVSVPAGSWPAARIGLVWVGTSGPLDAIEMHYGSAGLLRFHYHLETAADPGSETFIVENDQSLTSLDLSGERSTLARRLP